MVVPPHVDEVVCGELKVHSLDAGQGQDGDIEIDGQRICPLGAGTQLLSINLRNLEKSQNVQFEHDNW